jgi:hypothetical protein
MKPPEGYRPRKGDVVLIRATVKYDVREDDDDGYCFVVTERRSDFSANLGEIVEFVSRAWDIGDRAMLPSVHGAADLIGEIVGVHDGWVWLKSADDLGTYNGSSLVPVPPEPDTSDIPEASEEFFKSADDLGTYNGSSLVPVPPEPDTSDIPEASEEFFKNAKLVLHEHASECEPRVALHVVGPDGEPIPNDDDEGRSTNEQR